jgi:glioma pathogenesis-related protein 2
MSCCSKFTEFEVDCLDAHNQFRSLHGSPRLELDKGLCGFAKEWAEYLKVCDIVKSSKTCTYGENIFFKCVERKVIPDPYEPVCKWYSEGSKYTGSLDECDVKDVKHFAQVIWKSSKALGVGYAVNEDHNKIYVVANYYPRGGDLKTFCANVKPLKGESPEIESCPSLVKIV